MWHDSKSFPARRRFVCNRYQIKLAQGCLYEPLVLVCRTATSNQAFKSCVLKSAVCISRTFIVAASLSAVKNKSCHPCTTPCTLRLSSLRYCPCGSLISACEPLRVSCGYSEACSSWIVPVGLSTLRCCVRSFLFAVSLSWSRTYFCTQLYFSLLLELAWSLHQENRDILNYTYPDTPTNDWTFFTVSVGGISRPVKLSNITMTASSVSSRENPLSRFQWGVPFYGL